MSISSAVIFPVWRMVGAGETPAGASPITPALDDVYKSEIRRLIGLGSVLTGSRAAGEDLAHDAFVHVLRRAERDPGFLRSPAWPLLRTILVRLAIQRRRSIAREGRRLARFWEPPSTEWWDPDPTLVDWHAALGKLPPRMRACVVLFYGEDLSTADVARALRCSPRTVEHQLHSARNKLTEALRVPSTSEGAQ
jgi:RNA polymerase sigma-70 factor (ECF subfamily)